jgi:hypothetical protein
VYMCARVPSGSGSEGRVSSVQQRHVFVGCAQCLHLLFFFPPISNFRPTFFPFFVARGLRLLALARVTQRPLPA